LEYSQENVLHICTLSTLVRACIVAAVALGDDLLLRQELDKLSSALALRIGRSNQSDPPAGKQQDWSLVATTRCWWVVLLCFGSVSTADVTEL
jgi:hypothetical protein